MRKFPQKHCESELSRRSVLKAVAFAAGAVPAIGTTLVSNPAVAQAKAPKSMVQYRDSPKGNQRCDNCALFEPPRACKSVAGVISPRGWCNIWVKR